MVSNSAMFPDLNFVDYVMAILGLLLCFKRAAEMERYYHLRVVIFTSIFGAIVVFLLLAVGAAFDDHFQYDYYEGPDHFTESEM